jgi:hypothetical protein
MKAWVQIPLLTQKLTIYEIEHKESYQAYAELVIEVAECSRSIMSKTGKRKQFL